MATYTYSDDSDTNCNLAEVYTTYTSAIPGKPYEKSKNVPSPAVPAKKVEPQVNRVEFEASKAGKRSLDEQKEDDTRTYNARGVSSMGGIVRPTRKKGRSRVPKHSDLVESALKQYEEDRAEQDQEEEEEEGEEEEGEGEEDMQKYSGLGASFERLPRNRDSKAKLSHTVDSVLGLERPIDWGNQFAGSRPKETPAKRPNDESDWLEGVGGTGGQLDARVKSDRPKETSAKRSKPQPSQSIGIGGTGGQLGARLKSGRPKEAPAGRPELSKATEYGGQLGAKVTTNKPKDTPAGRPELQSSLGKKHSESPLMSAKGPVAGKGDTPQAPKGFQVTRDQAQTVEYLEELDSGDDK